ncbi:hypothetical protein PV11_03509 [Exophiala sideris]|uniref:Major facilitator superfamily (MFS) profile domain-containing protein n=1 Tax=Exophiala sideris TaxID=1016849 RepID=A0A0D1YED7_9EURO|nr:hypothetical protein PV11_03509 [Exophiala sideris]
MAADPLHGHENNKEQQMHEHEVVPEDETVAVRSKVRRYVAIASPSFVYCVSLGPYLCITPIITTINNDLGPHPGYAWMASSWTITTGVGLLLGGTISDIVGRRWFAVGTTSLAIISAILGITAKSVGQIIAANAFLGLNQADALTGFAGIAELVQTKSRGAATAFANTTVGVWTLGGSLFGHEFATRTRPGWRSVYWMTLATNIVALVTVYFSYHPARPLLTAQKTTRQILKNFDYVGAFFILTGPTLVFVGVINVSEYSPKSAHFLGPFISGLILLICLALWEVFGTRNPLLHPFLFSRLRTFTLICIVTFLSGGILFYGVQALFPQYLVLVYGDDATQTGLDRMPLGAATWIGGISSSFLLQYLGPRIGTTATLSLGAFMTALFTPLLALADGASKSMVYAFSCLAGFGTGIIDSYTLPLITLAALDELIGLAIGTIGFMRSIGGAAGISIFSSILTSKAAIFIPAQVVPAALKAGLPETSLAEFLGILTGAVQGQDITKVPGITPPIIVKTTAALQGAYLGSFKYVWYSGIAFSVLAFCLSLFIKDLSPHMTTKIPQHLKEEEVLGNPSANMVEDNRLEKGNEQQHESALWRDHRSGYAK